jgi:hypothetical protein
VTTSHVSFLLSFSGTSSSKENLIKIQKERQKFLFSQKRLSLFDAKNFTSQAVLLR